MLDRILKLIVTLTLLLFLVQVVIGVLIRVLEAALSGGVTSIGQTASFLTNLVFTGGMACLLAGLLVRLSRFVSARDPRSARERTSRDRAMRVRARRPADGVTPHERRRAHVVDGDPAVGEDEGGR